MRVGCGGSHRPRPGFGIVFPRPMMTGRTVESVRWACERARAWVISHHGSIESLDNTQHKSGSPADKHTGPVSDRQRENSRTQKARHARAKPGKQGGSPTLSHSAAKGRTDRGGHQAGRARRGQRGARRLSIVDRPSGSVTHPP